MEFVFFLLIHRAKFQFMYFSVYFLNIQPSESPDNLDINRLF